MRWRRSHITSSINVIPAYSLTNLCYSDVVRKRLRRARGMHARLAAMDNNTQTTKVSKQPISFVHQNEPRRCRAMTWYVADSFKSCLPRQLI